MVARYLMGKEKLLPIFALLVLLVACTSSVYVYATSTNSPTISINGARYTIDQVFRIGTQKSFEVDGVTYSGVGLDDFIKKTGVTAPENHEYTLIGADGYQKTVKWENMKNGLITKEKNSVFSDLPKAFRVKDLVAIEVK